MGLRGRMFLLVALLFAILLAIRLKYRNLPHGILTGMFFILYAGFRIGAEFFREIDAGQAPIMGMNPGQFYSLFMVAIGVAFVGYGLRNCRAWSPALPRTTRQRVRPGR